MGIGWIRGKYGYWCDCLKKWKSRIEARGGGLSRKRGRDKGGKRRDVAQNTTTSHIMGTKLISLLK